jgi:hypothetical protein
MSELGPVEMLVVGFPGNQFHGDIVPALKAKIDDGTIAVLDALFVSKDADGDVLGFEVTELPDDVRIQYEGLEIGESELLSEEDVEELGESLDPSSSIVALVIEHRWAAELAGAMRDADGELLLSMRIPHEAVDEARSLGSV